MTTFRLQSAFADLLVFAQDNANPGAGGAPVNQTMLLWLGVVGMVFYFMMIRPQQREQKQRQERLDALKKNDKVVTIGGMIGTIVDLSQDGKRLTLRVDDSTRIKFLRASIQSVYDESDGENSDGK